MIFSVFVFRLIFHGYSVAEPPATTNYACEYWPVPVVAAAALVRQLSGLIFNKNRVFGRRTPKIAVKNMIKKCQIHLLCRAIYVVGLWHSADWPVF